MDFHLMVDASIDEAKFNADLERVLEKNGFPPFRVTCSGNDLMVSVNSSNMPETSVRQTLKLALGRQPRQLQD